MYNVEIYEKSNGKSELREFIEDLAEKSNKGNKDARNQLEKINFCVELLKREGFNLRHQTKYTKHISGQIWELRPGNNRVFYFYYDNGTFVLLHHFLKKSMKTPAREIQKAEREMKDYIKR